MISHRQEARPLPPVYTEVTQQQFAELKAEVRREVLAELRPFLAALLAPPPPPPPPPKPASVMPRGIGRVIEVTLAVTGMSREELMGERRARRVSWVRQVAMTLCCDMVPSASLPMIGRAFGKDHTTIMHAKKVVAQRLAQGDVMTTDTYHAIKTALEETA